MLSGIRINTQNAALSIKTQNATLRLQSAQMNSQMSGNAPEQLQLSTTYPKISIDQTASFASAGLKTMHSQVMDYFAASNQRGMSKIGEISSEGLEMLAVEKNKRAIQSISSRAGMRDVQISVKSTVPPEISFTPGEVTIQAPYKPVQVDWTPVKGQLNYTPGMVEITLDPPPSIEIWVEPGIELNFHNVVGKNVDTAS